MNEIILKASNLNKYFREPDEFHVLKNINLEIKRGEFATIIGKSGCGKSTLLYLLSTMDTDYDGKIEMNGEQLTGKTQNQFVGGTFYTKTNDYYDGEYTLSEIADLNGDGKMEMIVKTYGYEENWLKVFEIKAGKPSEIKILSYYCGV